MDFALTLDPGTEFQYSNLGAHLLGIFLSRACGTDLKSYAQANLFTPMGVEVGDWTRDWEGYRLGYGEIHLTARDLAKFGQLYLNDGQFEGTQIVRADWVRDSLEMYSEDAWKITGRAQLARQRVWLSVVVGSGGRPSL